MMMFLNRPCPAPKFFVLSKKIFKKNFENFSKFFLVITEKKFFFEIFNFLNVTDDSKTFFIFLRKFIIFLMISLLKMKISGVPDLLYMFRSILELE